VALKTDTGTEAELVLTGGDASDLLAALIRPAVHKPLLVLEGLKKLSG
jgi:pantothenate kinase type III